MSTNRKLTDFFKPQPPVPPAVKKEDEEAGDVIVVDTTFRQNLRNAAKRPRDEQAKNGQTEPAHNKTINSKKNFKPEFNDLDNSIQEQVQPSISHYRPSGIAGSGGITKTSRLVVKDSDAEESDSDSSLEDIDVLLKKPNASTFSQRLPDRSSSSKPITSSNSGIRFAGADHSPETPKYKFSLACLVEQKQKNLASEADAARARAALGSTQGLRNATSSGTDLQMQDAGPVHGTDDVPHRGLLAAIVAEKGDEGALQKVLNALKRTEALNRDMVSYFFERGSSITPPSCSSYPEAGNAIEEWQYRFQDTAERQQAYLSGFVRDMSNLGCRLPKEVVEWILYDGKFSIRHLVFQYSFPNFAAVCSEPRDDLMHAYFEALKVNEAFNDGCPPERLPQMFRYLGGTAEATKLGHTARLVAETPYEDCDQASINLAPVVQFLGENAKNMSTSSREYAVCVLARMTVDPQVVGNGELLTKIENAIALLVSRYTEELEAPSLLRIGTDIAKFFSYSPLQFQLLNCLPLHTPCLHLFRRRLALAFFFEDTSYLSRRENDLLQIQRIIKRLRKSDFEIGTKTNYKKLSSIMSILDIGIDNGVSPSTLVTRDDENAFNEDIDSLAESIKALFTKIFDTGASYMARTEAKAVLERVHYRLIYAVRTKERPKTSIFTQDETTQSTMTQFLSKPSKRDGDPNSHSRPTSAQSILRSSR